MPKRERRIDVCDPGDERDRGVPDRKCVAGVKPSVLELVDDVDRSQVELLELPDPSQVEQPVAVDRARRPPDRAREDRPSRGDAGNGPALGRLGGEQARAAGPARAQTTEKPASSQSVVSIVPSKANVSARAPARATRLHTNEAATATPKAAGRPRARAEDSAGTSTTQAAAAASRSESAGPCAGNKRARPRVAGAASNQRQEERGGADPARPRTVGPHRHAHDSHSSASSASVPACTQMPPRARTSSMNRRYSRSQPG